MPATYSISLTVLFYALIVAEFFVPSGGVLGVAAAVAALTAIVIAFTHSFTFGLTIVLVLMVTTPVLFILIVRIWPKTAVGRNMLNRQVDSRMPDPPEPKTLDGVPLSSLVGRIGVARTHLLPSGQIVVDGHKANAVSSGQPIDADSPVWVTRCVGSQLQVRVALEEEVAQHAWKIANPTDAESGLVPGRDAAGVTIPSALDDIDLDDMGTLSP